MVCPSPMGRGRSSYAEDFKSPGTKKWRSTLSIADRTRGSLIPLALIWVSTILSRMALKSPFALEVSFPSMEQAISANPIENRIRGKVLLSMILTLPVEKFRFPEPVDPFGRPSGRHLLTLRAIPRALLDVSTQVNSGLLPWPANSIRRLKSWRRGRPVPGMQH